MGLRRLATRRFSAFLLCGLFGELCLVGLSGLSGLASAGEVVQEYEFTFPGVEQCLENDGRCIPWGSGGDLVVKELFPLVPQRVASITIPAGEVPVTVTVETGTSRSVPYKSRLASQLYPMTPGAFVGRKVDPYDGSAFPPDWQGQWRVDHFRGHKIVRVPLYPFRVISNSAAMFVTQMRVTVATKTTFTESSPVSRGLARDTVALAERVDNFANLESRIIPPTEELGYLIIGPRALIGNESDTPLRPLINEKSDRHIHVSLAALEDIGNRPQPEDIRAFIRSRHTRDSVDYVLLIGDRANLPWKYVKSGMRGDGDPVPSDQYYACLDGDFSSPKTIDWTCEVAVGRVGARTRAEVANWVDKNMAFVEAIKQGRTQQALSFGERLDGRTLGGRMLDYITGGTTKSPASRGYPGHVSVTKLYDGSGPEVSSLKFLEVLNQGDFHVVNHLGHANHNYVFRMNDSAIDGFRSRPAFYYSQGCYPNDPDKDNWTIKAVRMPDFGPVAMIANTRYGWYAPGNSEEGSSSVLHRTFWAMRFEKGLKRIGEMNHRAKEVLGSASPSPVMIYTLLESNLIGDPELDLGL